MNVSGVLVQTRPEHIEQVVNLLKEIEFVDYHMHNELGKIVVTIEGENVSEETARLHLIQKIPHVLAADMMYAFAEDELDAERDKLSQGTILPDWLNNPNAKPEEIHYNGDLKAKGF